MTVFFGILLALGVFFLVVLVHELGHFLTARMTGMKVHEFGFGIPPKMKRLFTDKQGTEFTLNWLPVGGFVRIAGEDARSPDAFKAGSFMSKSLPKRLLVLVAGVVMNFLLAWVIFFGIFVFGARPLSVLPVDAGRTYSYFLPSISEGIERGFAEHEGIILTPLSGSIAEGAGIRPGDKLLSVNSHPAMTIDAVIGQFQSHNSLELTLRGEDGSEKMLTITPYDGKIGTMIGYDGLMLHTGAALERYGFGEAAVMASKETYATSLLTFRLFSKTLQSFIFPRTETEREDAKNMLSGPIGVGGAFVSMINSQVPVVIIFLFIALLSINLGVLNILPFPALDGGRMVTTMVYSLLSWSHRTRQYVITFEGWFHFLGFTVLMLFMVYVALLDITRFF